METKNTNYKIALGISTDIDNFIINFMQHNIEDGFFWHKNGNQLEEEDYANIIYLSVKASYLFKQIANMLSDQKNDEYV